MRRKLSAILSAFPLLAMLALVTALSGCATPPAKESADTQQPAQTEPEVQPTQADLDLATGLKLYDAGKHAEAMVYLERSIEAVPTWAPDLANAHKHMAFIHCAATRIEPCREQFRLAIEADADFALTPSEIGHPIWGPVYREVSKQKK